MKTALQFIFICMATSVAIASEDNTPPALRNYAQSSNLDGALSMIGPNSRASFGTGVQAGVTAFNYFNKIGGAILTGGTSLLVDAAMSKAQGASNTQAFSVTPNLYFEDVEASFQLNVQQPQCQKSKTNLLMLNHASLSGYGKEEMIHSGFDYHQGENQPFAGAVYKAPGGAFGTKGVSVKYDENYKKSLGHNIDYIETAPDKITGKGKVYQLGSAPKVGDELWIIGYPKSGGPERRKCKYIGANPKDYSLIGGITNALECEGQNSGGGGYAGGPILNKNGEVVGMVDRARDKQVWENGIIKKELIENCDVRDSVPADWDLCAASKKIHNNMWDRKTDEFFMLDLNKDMVSKSCDKPLELNETEDRHYKTCVTDTPAFEDGTNAQKKYPKVIVPGWVEKQDCFVRMVDGKKVFTQYKDKATGDITSLCSTKITESKNEKGAMDDGVRKMGLSECMRTLGIAEPFVAEQKFIPAQPQVPTGSDNLDVAPVTTGLR